MQVIVIFFGEILIINFGNQGLVREIRAQEVFINFLIVRWGLALVNIICNKMVLLAIYLLEMSMTVECS